MRSVFQRKLALQRSSRAACTASTAALRRHGGRVAPAAPRSSRGGVRLTRRAGRMRLAKEISTRGRERQAMADARSRCVPEVIRGDAGDAAKVDPYTNV